MTTKLKKMARALNDAYTETFDTSFELRFRIKVETRLDLWSMGLVTCRIDGEQLSLEQSAWCEAYSDGYVSAMTKVRDAA